MRATPRQQKKSTRRGQATVLAAIRKLILKYKRKRADYHKSMMRARRRNDEMTQVVAGALALAYTEAQVNLERIAHNLDRGTNGLRTSRRIRRG